ncbi:MAG: hypothetical protein IID45_01670, partial [Planctomycetes bacterium]|nr:hypothetical protein [Planctomycetota bacterium]
SGMNQFQLAECESWDAVTVMLDCWLEPGDVVLVKGSRAMRMERVIEWMREKAKAMEKQQEFNSAAQPMRERICA